MNITKECPMCTGKFRITLVEDEAKVYALWLAGVGHIQDVPNLSPTEREFLKTGYCPHCQSLMFGDETTERIRPLGA